MKFGGRTVTAIVPFPKSRILLVKRGTVVFKGYWALPGGKVASGETVQEAVVREVNEETGVLVKVVAKIGDYRETGVQDGVEYDYFATCFLTEPIGGEFSREEEEIDEIQLVELNKIPSKLAFEHSRMIEDYLNKVEGKQ